MFSLAGVTLADHMERKENERKLSDSPPLLYKSAINEELAGLGAAPGPRMAPRRARHAETEEVKERFSAHKIL